MTDSQTTGGKRRQPLSVWELPKLLKPMHEYKRSRPSADVKERPHFAAILAYIYRNRFVVGSQVQRRFENVLKSDRTARRHLAEMQDLGWIDTVPTRAVGPLWPKVYHVTPRGARRLRELLAAKGKSGHVIRLDRKRTGGLAANFVLHEVLLTEFLLSLFLTVQNRDDLELLRTERRSLATNPAFRVTVDGRRTRLNPDGMFLYRQSEKGMMLCFVELDLGTMSLGQMDAKFRAYESWCVSSAGKGFLCETYARHGANDPRPCLRVLTIAAGRGGTNDRRRLDELAAIADKYQNVRQIGWFAAIGDGNNGESTNGVVEQQLWRRIGLEQNRGSFA